MKGHIKITDKVYFVPDKLPKPDEIIMLNLIEKYEGNEYEAYLSFKEKIKEYEASKKTVEVSNETCPIEIKNNEYWILLEKSLRAVKNKTPCEAEVTDNKAIITKLL